MNEDNKISTIEEMKEKALQLAKSIPHLQEKAEFMTTLRGFSIEFSIIVERCLNQLISETGNEMVIDKSKRELYLIKGIRIKKDMPRFRAKSRDMQKLIEKIFSNHGTKLEDGIVFEKFKRFEELRDIFAHVPVNWNSAKLEFVTDDPYKHFFKDPRWKDVLFANREFIALFEWLIELILAYNRNILMKKEFLSLIFLGKSQAEIKKLTENNKTDEKLKSSKISK